MLVISVNDTVDPDIVNIIAPKSVDVYTFINFTIVMRLKDNASGIKIFYRINQLNI